MRVLVRGHLVVAGAALLVALPLSARAAAPGVSVTPAASSEDQPVHVVVRGLVPAQAVTIRLTSTDAQHFPWASSATFHADASGTVDVDRAASVAGAYRGVWSMGLIARLTPTRSDPFGAYQWPTVRALPFTVTVRAQGRTIARTTFRRRFAASPVRFEHESVEARGFYGEYWTPSVPGRHPAILAFGGPEGGDGLLDLVSGTIAGHGYPTLDLAYFGRPGLPTSLSRIPLEYFVHALAWLRKQPHVDPSRIVVLGVSRGSEAAQLLAIHFPTLVHGVVATVPSSVVLCGLPRCNGPAWTLHGKALPFSRQTNRTTPGDDPAAVIPVEKIRGPVLLDCGGSDVTWHSCAYARAIIRRLDAHHDRFPHALYRYPHAGPNVGGLLQDEPFFPAGDPADERAREQFWPHLLAFLGRL